MEFRKFRKSFSCPKLISVSISVVLNALFEKHFFFTKKGVVEIGSPTTLDAYPASNAMQQGKINKHCLLLRRQN
jgi:hypothetical protein